MHPVYDVDDRGRNVFMGVMAVDYKCECCADSMQIGIYGTSPI